MSLRTEETLEAMDIGMSDAERTAMVKSLNKLLADLFVLYTKARNYHWNVEGPNFFALHAEFEKLYTGLAGDVDAVAERVRALGGVAAGTMAEFLELASLKEATGVHDASGMVSDLASDYEQVISSVRDKVYEADQVHDIGTGDFLTGLMEGYEKTAWMLRSFLQ